MGSLSDEGDHAAVAESPSFIANMKQMDKPHLVERYGLFVILQLGEAVAVASNALPPNAGPRALATAGAAFVTAALGWGLYFSAHPFGFQRLPPSSGAFAVLSYSYNHIFILAALPALAAGFARAVEHAASLDEAGGGEEEEEASPHRRLGRLLEGAEEDGSHFYEVEA